MNLSLMIRNSFIWRIIYSLTRTVRSRYGTYPRWKKLGFEKIVIEKKGNAKNILIATSVGSHLAAATIESTLGAALKLRGHNVESLLCDGILPACMDCEHSRFQSERAKAKLAGEGPKYLCSNCGIPSVKMYSDLDIYCNFFGKYITAEDKRNAERIIGVVDRLNIKHFKIDNVAVGEHALAGALRFFARGDLETESNGIGILDAYFRAALYTYYMADKLFSEKRFDVLVLNHGIYIPQGVIAEVAKKHGIRVVTWNPAYRAKTFIFSHGDTYHHTMMSEPISSWLEMKWCDSAEKSITDYLKSRWHGTKDWIWFHDKPEFDVKNYLKNRNVNTEKPLIGLLTNVIWDAQLHYPANTFENMIEWVIESIDYFSKRNDLQLLIRIHPAEIRGAIPSRQFTEEEIYRRFLVLPENIFIVGPAENISTYPLMEACDSVVIYGTKSGVELTSVGIPVIVAGEAWIRGKGITFDASNREEYFSILDKLPFGERLSINKQLLAKKYAFHFFMRRMIPLSFVEKRKGWPPYFIDIKNVNQLLPGCDPGLDVICEGITEGTEFIFKAENTHR